MLCEHDPDVVYCFTGPSTVPTLASRARDVIFSTYGFSLEQLLCLTDTFLWEGEYTVSFGWSYSYTWNHHVYAFHEADARQKLDERIHTHNPQSAVLKGMRRPPNVYPYGFIENTHHPHRFANSDFAKLVRVLRFVPPDDLERLFATHLVANIDPWMDYYTDEEYEWWTTTGKTLPYIVDSDTDSDTPARLNETPWEDDGFDKIWIESLNRWAFCALKTVRPPRIIH